MLDALPFQPLHEALQRCQQGLPFGPSPALWLTQGADVTPQLIRPRAWDLLNAHLASIPSPFSELWLSVMKVVFAHSSHPGFVDGLGRGLLLLSQLSNSLLVPLQESKKDRETPSMSRDRVHSALKQKSVLRLLMQPRGILLYDKTPTEENGRVGGIDWLDLVTHDAKLELSQRGDFFSLSSCPTAPQESKSKNGRPLPRTPSVYALIAGSAYHILATEVEGDVRDTLHRVLMVFLFLDGEEDCSVQRSLQREWLGTSLFREKECSLLARVKQRLETLHVSKFVVHCFANALPSRRAFSAASRDEAPTFAASIASSQVLRRGLFFLPLVGSSNPGWRSDLFIMNTGTCSSPLCHSQGLLCSHEVLPLKAILLRIDPAGEWLSEAEDLYNTQTFFSYYSNDESDLDRTNSFIQRGCKGKKRTSELTTATLHHHAREDEEELEESFYAMQARQACTTSCLIAGTGTQRGRAGHRVDPPAMEDRPNLQSDEERFFENLVNRVCARLLSSFQKDKYCAEGVTYLEFKAVIRLLLWCLLHEVRVVLTPEQVPAIFKLFAIRYGPVLEEDLKAFEGLCPWEKQGQGSSEEVEGQPRVRIVDQLHLECFERLLRALPCLHEPTKYRERSVARSTAILSRDRLRLPPIVEDAVLSLSTCSLTTIQAARIHAQQEAATLEAMLASVYDIPVLNQLVCVLQVSALPVFAESQSNVASLGGSILITAPTRPLEECWIRLLRKCASTLHGIFHHPLRLCDSSLPCAPEYSVTGEGVIRAGGAFFSAFHRCLRRRIAGLRSGQCGSSFPDLQALIHTLDQLAMACLGVLYRLSRGVLMDTTLSHSASGGLDLGGPRARERLWQLATQHAARLQMPFKDPELHVFLRTIHEKADMLMQRTKQQHPHAECVQGAKKEIHSAGGDSDCSGARLHASNSSYDQALRLFASDLILPPLSECVNKAAKGGDPSCQPPAWMFVEPIEPNREAVRLALVACYLIAITL